MANIYLVRQEHTHLFGDTLVSAVVIAESERDARSILTSDLNDTIDPITWDESMWAVTRLGNNAKIPPSPFKQVVCKDICCKDQLPSGNYAQRKPIVNERFHEKFLGWV